HGNGNGCVHAADGGTRIADVVVAFGLGLQAGDVAKAVAGDVVAVVCVQAGGAGGHLVGVAPVGADHQCSAGGVGGADLVDRLEVARDRRGGLAGPRSGLQLGGKRVDHAQAKDVVGSGVLHA